MRKLTRDLRNVYKSLKEKPDKLPEIEMIQRRKLKKIDLDV